MQEPDWAYLSNPFDNVTRESHRRMRLLATDHFSKLRKRAENDPEIKALLDLGEPYFEAYLKQLRTGSKESSLYRMNTARVEDLLAELSGTLARRWDVSIMVEYDKVTPEYEALLPKGRKVFQQGSYEERIEAIQVLAEQLTLFPVLDNLRAEVEEFGTKIVKARDIQQGLEGEDQYNVDELEKARKKLADVLYGIYGGLIRRFWEERKTVESFYELRYFRRGNAKSDDTIRQTLNAIVPAEGSVTVLEGELTEGDEVRFTNVGGRTFFIASKENPEERKEIPSGRMEILTVAAGTTAFVLTNESTLDTESIVELL
ncbi:MAG: hypothetical protein AAF740_03635 [Bacteroidota bacterium]